MARRSRHPAPTPPPPHFTPRQVDGRFTLPSSEVYAGLGGLTSPPSAASLMNNCPPLVLDSGYQSLAWTPQSSVQFTLEGLTVGHSPVQQPCSGRLDLSAPALPVVSRELLGPQTGVPLRALAPSFPQQTITSGPPAAQPLHDQWNAGGGRMHDAVAGYSGAVERMPTMLDFLAVLAEDGLAE